MTTSMPLPTPHPSLELTGEVAAALHDGAPVVALESTIISHGMPYPDNVAMALEVEQIVRDGGAVPATIAVLGGDLHVGLGQEELERLATGDDVAKASVRDLPTVIAQRRDGATTVAATMRLASLAGIHVFVTGGLGGVHRGAPQSFDISADLNELSTTDVAVVSAGAKSILDLGLTLETLETLSVPVVAYGTDTFPAFFTRDSGFDSPLRADSPEEVAAMMAAKWGLGIEGGLAIVVPIPEADEIPADQIDHVIARALADMEERGIGGRDATPFLLDRIVELTDGASLVANVALVRNNARLGTAIATAFADRSRG